MEAASQPSDEFRLLAIHYRIPFTHLSNRLHQGNGCRVRRCSLRVVSASTGQLIRWLGPLRCWCRSVVIEVVSLVGSGIVIVGLV